MINRRVMGGTAWTVGGYAAMQVFRFGFNVSLAHLVAPKVFGMMALVGLFLQGLQMFSDLGIRQCVIRHVRGDEPAFLNTAWTVQVLRGIVLWIGALLLAGPIATFYQEDTLLWLIPLAGLGAFITGFSSTSLLTCSREVRRGPLVRRELGVYVGTYTAVLIAVALIRQRWPAGEAHNLEIAVIALGTVVAAIGEVALSFTLRAIARPGFAWDPEARRELLRFGGWVFVSSACTFCAAQADRLVVGKLSLELLGVYHVAVVIAALPAGVLAALGIHLVFPLMTDAMREGEPFAVAFRRAHRALVVAAGLLIPGMACVGPAVVGILYDNRYAATAEFIRYLAVAAWFTALLIPGELALLALGRTRGMALAQAVRLACLPGFLFAGYVVGGIPGLIVGVACGELVRYVVVVSLLSQVGIRVYPVDAALTVLAALVVGTYVLVEDVAGPHSRITVPIIGAVVQTAIWLAVYLIWTTSMTLPLRSLAFGSRPTTDSVPS